MNGKHMSFLSVYEASEGVEGGENGSNCPIWLLEALFVSMLKYGPCRN